MNRTGPSQLTAFIAATAHDVLDIDLSTSIDESARYPTYFAVDLPHPLMSRMVASQL
jgi:hypothetical protein